MPLTKNGRAYKVFLQSNNKKKAVEPKKPAFIKRVPDEVVKQPEKPGEPANEVVIRGKIVVYTCITGGYDALTSPKKTDGVDYICFTDNLDMNPNGWELRPVPEDLKDLSKVKQQRMVKVLPHKYLADYDISVWVDGSVDVKGDIKEFLSSIIYTGYSIFIPTHPSRDCIYKECAAVKAIKKDTTDLPDKQMKKYKADGYPEKNGLVQSNIVVRWHNNEDCVEVMEAWAREIREFSHRDQLSFNYALWKTKATCFKAIDKKTCNSKYFFWNANHRKKKVKK